MFAPSRFYPIVSTLCLLAALTACSKKEIDPTKGFSSSIQSIISQADIDGLRQRGMPINEGSQPPNIEGIYVSSPHELVSPYGPDDDYEAGYEFEDLILRFSNQNSADQSAQVQLKNGNTTGSGQGGFLAGNGNQFTFFARIDIQSGSATAQQVRIFSGEMTPDGIKNFYTTLLLTSKIDPDDDLIPVGTSRIIKDGNGLASKRSSFRMAAPAGADLKTKPEETRR